MHDWNVIATVRERRRRDARELLRRFGFVDRTQYPNVLVMNVPDIHAFLESLQGWLTAHPAAAEVLGHVAPFSEAFSFQSPEEFEAKSRELVLKFVPSLTGRQFHVRMHRRGFKGRLHTIDEEQLLGRELLNALEKAGTPGKVSYDDPDAIVSVETVDNRAGLACWSREELQRYPCLHPE
ncbi:MAG: hypothetical protein ACM3U2_03165 [Deltaproteobacteria bacterium]